MHLFHLFLVAVLQGTTEFLPISSSGHLILFPALTGFADQGQVIDVAVHVGTLGAVVLYFWRDVATAIRGVPGLLRWQIDSQETRLALGLVVATIPAVLVGLVLQLTGWYDALRSVTVIGWATLLFGILLYFADRTGQAERETSDWSLRHALILGLWQVLSLIPGTSRSGIAITGARLLGYKREDAARVSMLMSIPLIFASGTLLASEVAYTADMQAARDGALAALFAFIAAFAALALMMRLLRSVSFTPYVIYRIVLGVGLLVMAYT